MLHIWPCVISWLWLKKVTWFCLSSPRCGQSQVTEPTGRWEASHCSSLREWDYLWSSAQVILQWRESQPTTWHIPEMSQWLKVTASFSSQFGDSSYMANWSHGFGTCVQAVLHHIALGKKKTHSNLDWEKTNHYWYWLRTKPLAYITDANQTRNKA